MNISGVFNDKIEELSHQLFSEILKSQQDVMALRPPDPEKANMPKDLLAEYEAVKGRGFFYHYLSTGRGHGPFTEIVDGSVKYDLIAGIGVNLLGHSHPLFIKAHLESACSDTVMCGNLLTYPEASQLSKALIESVPKTRLKHFWFANSGSFANDSALKMIWQKVAPKYKLIAFEKAFAGRSIATQDITYNKAYRDGMPSNLDVLHVPHFDEKNPHDALNKTLTALDLVWTEHGSEVGAMMMEIVQGEGGFVFGVQEYYEGVFEWARSKNIFIWIDEVQTFGRTTELFAFQKFNLDQYVDILTVGKALQACGTFYTEELNPKPGLVAGTFNGSLVALNTGLKTLRYLQEGHFYGEKGRIAQLENKFSIKLRFLSQNSCKDIIGKHVAIGTMIAFEVGKSNKEDTVKFIKKLYDNGIISFMAGSAPVRVRFLLPLSMTDAHIDEIFKIIESTALEVFAH